MHFENILFCRIGQLAPLFPKASWKHLL